MKKNEELFEVAKKDDEELLDFEFDELSEEDLEAASGESVSDDEIITSAYGLKPFSEYLKEFISVQVAVLIINFFKMVEVNHNYTEVLAGLKCAVDLNIKRFIHISSVKYIC